MMIRYPDALACDMAETYGVFNIKSLPARIAATLAVGLRDDARVKMAASQTPVKDEIVLLACIADCVRWIQWSMTKAAADGGNPPGSLLDYYLGIDRSDKTAGYNTPEEFWAARERILEGT